MKLHKLPILLFLMALIQAPTQKAQQPRAIAASTTAVSVANSYVTHSGGLIEMLIGSGAPPYTSVPANVTAVTDNPTFMINGQPLAVIGPIWSGGNPTASPCVAYQPYLPGTPPTPITFAATDVITWAAPAGWVTCGTNVAPAQTGTAGNYAGGYEPGTFQYTGFGLANNPPKMKIGLNVGMAQQGWLQKNAMTRAPQQAYAWNHAATSSQYGFPLTVDATGTTSASVWASIQGNGIDAKKYPCPLGVWTLCLDETAPATPMVPTFSSSLGTSYVALVSSTPGTVVNGVEMNKQWTWQVNDTGAPQWDLVLTIGFTTPGKNTGPVTVVNPELFPPGEKVVRNCGFTIADNFLAQVQSGTKKVPVFLRWLPGPDGCSQHVVAEDLLPASATNFNAISSLTTTIQISSIRTYDPVNTSPTIYTHERYRNCRASSTYPGYPYEWSPTDYGFGYDWWFLANATRPNRACVFEAVCAAPHGLKSGQNVVFAPNCPPVNAINTAGQPGTLNLAGWQAIAWVTSPTTFLSLGGCSYPFANGTGTVVGSQIVNTTCVRNWTPFPPVEAYGAASVTQPRMGTYISVNHAMTDGAVTAFAQRIYNSTARGSLVYVQCSNEIFFGNYPDQWLDGFAQMTGFGDNVAPAWMKRTGEIHQIFTDVWGEDQKSLVRVFQTMSVTPQITLDAMVYAHQHSIPIDAVASSAYIDIPNSPSWQMAAAQMCADNTDSIANSPRQPLMPVAVYADLLRHYQKYGPWNAPNNVMSQHYAALQKSGYGIATNPPGFSHPMPPFIGYENAMDALIPSAVSLTNHLVRPGLTHDQLYDPSFREVMIEFLCSMQQPGPIGTPGFTQVGIVEWLGTRFAGGSAYTCSDGKSDATSVNVWPTYYHQQQLPGLGVGAKYWSATLGGDGADHSYQNQSVAGQTLLDWMSLSN